MNAIMDTMTSWFTTPLNSRLFVELVFQSCSQFANFTPSSPYALGDYGHVDKLTGMFIKEGSIFELYPELKDVVQPQGTPEGTRVYFASRERGTATELKMDAAAIPLVDCEAKWGWEFRKDRHAALICKDPIHCELVYEGRLMQVLTMDKHLYKKAVVMKLVKCTSYAMLLTTGQKGKTYIGFKAQAVSPIPLAVGGAGAVKSWEYGGETGNWATGLYEPNVHQYYPLLTLRRISRHRRVINLRGKTGVDTGIKKEIITSTLHEVYRPWGELDEEGNDLDEDESDSPPRDNDDGFAPMSKRNLALQTAQLEAENAFTVDSSDEEEMERLKALDPDRIGARSQVEGADA